MLEGLWAQKKIGRSDDRGFVAVERQTEIDMDLERLERLRRHEEAGELRPRWPSSTTTSTSGELWDDLNLEDLVGELSDFLLQSGFGYEQGEWDEDNLQALHDAILEALMRRGLLSDEDLQKLMGDPEALDQFLQKVVERMVREGYLRASEQQPFHDPTDGGGGGPARARRSSSS